MIKHARWYLVYLDEMVYCIQVKFIVWLGLGLKLWFGKGYGWGKYFGHIIIRSQSANYVQLL